MTPGAASVGSTKSARFIPMISPTLSSPAQPMLKMAASRGQPQIKAVVIKPIRDRLQEELGDVHMARPSTKRNIHPRHLQAVSSV